MNWQTFSISPLRFQDHSILLVMGVIFALAMGVLGGMPPAIRAASRPVAHALRDL